MLGDYGEDEKDNGLPLMRPSIKKAAEEYFGIEL